MYKYAYILCSMSVELFVGLYVWVSLLHRMLLLCLVIEPRDLSMLSVARRNQCRVRLTNDLALNNHELHGACQPGNQASKAQGTIPAYSMSGKPTSF